LDQAVLAGSHVTLEPLTVAHRDALRDAASDERIWAWTLVRPIGAYFDSWFSDAMEQRDRGTAAPFGVRRCFDGRIVGSTSYLDINHRHRRIEIGSTWYSPDAWGTSVNPESKLLLLTHAFEGLGMHRVAFLTDELNTRSQRAIAKLGATQEGILRAHMVSQQGRVRNSVVFSITSTEWADVRRRLVQRLAAAKAQ
jgi:N-acetyltransferase